MMRFFRNPFALSRRFLSQPSMEKLMECVGEERMQILRRVVSHRVKRVTLVLENIVDEGNKAAVIRSADSYGLMTVHIVQSTPLRRHKLRTASAGSNKWINLVHHSSSVDCVKYLKNNGFRVLGTDLNAEKEVGDIDFVSQPVAIVMGNEQNGVTDELLAACDERFRLPGYGITQSLNISVAAGILTHLARSATDKFLDGRKSDLSEKEQEELLHSLIRYHFGAYDNNSGNNNGKINQEKSGEEKKE